MSLHYAKTLNIGLLLMVIIFVTAQAQQTHFNLESQNLFANKQITPTITGYITHGFTKKQVGVFAWFLVNKHWAEGYTGLNYKPFAYCQISLGAGLEQAERSLRLGSSVWLGNEKIYALIITEKGGSGFWHRAIMNYHLKGVVIGLMSQTKLGLGPRLEFKIPQTPFKVWGSVLNGKNVFLSLKMSF